MAEMVGKFFSAMLLDWYRQYGRDFPWRRHPQPYDVWVSEIMAQQTRLETVLPYYQRWMERFPTLGDLAAADQQEVLSVWEGLGYYSRARNLHRAAQVVISELGGQIPPTSDELRKLPGIGPYTAGAIASLAFGRDEAVVDGNVKRVLARCFGVRQPVNTPAGEKRIWELAREHLPIGQAGGYNQALMDLGATICLPRRPSCHNCPLAGICAANRENLQEELPVKKIKPTTPHYTVTAAVLWEDGKVLLAKRPQDDLLGGMWEYPGGKRESDETLPACLEREIFEELGVKIEVGEELGVFRHAYTHYRVTLHAFSCSITGGVLQMHYHNDLVWVSLAELGSYPMGKLDRQISRLLQERQK